MKKIKNTVLALMSLMVKSMAFKANDNMVFAENLPNEVKNFVQLNFPRQSVAYAEKNVTDEGTTYEVMLNDGTEVTFNNNGAWGMVDCKIESVPASLMPTTLKSFVASQFVETKVVRIAKMIGGYVATLSNGIVLRLDQNGALA